MKKSLSSQPFLDPWFSIPRPPVAGKKGRDRATVGGDGDRPLSVGGGVSSCRMGSQRLPPSTATGVRCHTARLRAVQRVGDAQGITRTPGPGSGERGHRGHVCAHLQVPACEGCTQPCSQVVHPDAHTAQRHSSYPPFLLVARSRL